MTSESIANAVPTTIDASVGTIAAVGATCLRRIKPPTQENP